MSIIGWIVLGLIAGWIAGLILNRHGYGIIRDTILGLFGALLGGWLGSLIFGLDVTGFNVISLVLAIVGAVIIVALYRVIFHRERRVT